MRTFELQDNDKLTITRYNSDTLETDVVTICYIDLVEELRRSLKEN